MNHLLTRAPVNKLAAVVVNQCRCADKFELNSLLEQRALLKKTATIWMQQSATSRRLSRENKPLIRDANKALQKLNKRLKPYDEWHRSNTPKDYDHAFRMTVRSVFGHEIFKQLELQAKALCDS